MGYDAVLFDCDGVIAESPDRAAMAAAMERVQRRFDLSGPSERMVAHFLRGEVSSITERCRSAGVDRDAFCAEAAREGVRAQLTEIRSGLRSAFDDVAALRDLNRPTGVVSDNHPRVVRALLERLGLTDRFETVFGCGFTASELRRQKPDPQGLRTAMETIGAESALYVGDRRVDVETAENAGVDSALVRRGESETEGDVAPTYEMKSLWGLQEVL